MSAARTERLLNLLTLLLNTRRPIALREIREMDEFGAYRTADPKSGERAFERDKAALVDLGVPLRWIAPENEDDTDGGEGLGGYIIDRERYYLAELSFNPAELALLSIAAAAAVAIEHLPGRAAVVRAMAKLGFDIDEETPLSTLVHAPVSGPVSPEQMRDNLELLHEAVARKKRVGLSYVRVSGEASKREFDPYGLYYRQGIWYVVGYCQLRQADRTFHLGRIKSIDIVNSGKLATEDFTVPEDFDLSAHVQRRPWEFPNETPVPVTIRLADRLVPAINEIFGSRAEVIRSGDETHVRIMVTYREALINAVLPFGAACEVLQPPDLRAQLREIYESLAQRYLPASAGNGRAPAVHEVSA